MRIGQLTLLVATIKMNETKENIITNDLFFNNGLLEVAEHTTNWKLLRRFPTRRGRNLNTELWELSTGNRTELFVLKYQQVSTTEFRNMVMTIEELVKQYGPQKKGIPFIKYANCNQHNDSCCMVPIIISPFLSGEPLSALLKKVLWNNADLYDERLGPILFACFSELREFHRLSVPSSTQHTDVLDLVETSVLLQYSHSLSGRKKKIDNLIDEVKLHQMDRIVTEMSNIGKSYIHRDCFPHNFMVLDNNVVRIIDWETLAVGNCMEDIAQMAGCLAVYFNAYNYGDPETTSIDRLVEEVYGDEITSSLSYKILLLKAIERFSPFGRRCFTILALHDNLAKSISKLSWPNMIKGYNVRYEKLFHMIKSTIEEQLY